MEEEEDHNVFSVREIKLTVSTIRWQSPARVGKYSVQLSHDDLLYPGAECEFLCQFFSECPTAPDDVQCTIFHKTKTASEVRNYAIFSIISTAEFAAEEPVATVDSRKESLPISDSNRSVSIAIASTSEI